MLVLCCNLSIHSSFANFTEKPIVVIIPSYNNATWYKKNLESVLSQNYSNYRIIYINDASTDDTGNLVQSYIERYGRNNLNFQLIQNILNIGALENLYKAIYTCDDNEIIVTLDGDDWLAHNDVLKTLNKVYTTKNVLLTYGQYIRYPDYVLGHNMKIPSDVVEQNTFRDFSAEHLPISHVRTFYAWLFKKIIKKDLQDANRRFFQMTWDAAMMFPMIEMAGRRFAFIPDILYVYNTANPINDHKISRQKQLELYKKIRAKPRYQRISD